METCFRFVYGNKEVAVKREKINEEASKKRKQTKAKRSVAQCITWKNIKCLQPDWQTWRYENI